MEAMMERRTEVRQLDLLMPMVDGLVPQLFDVASRAQIVSLLEALLNDRLVAARMPEAEND
jgi:hypothetical protein